DIERRRSSVSSWIDITVDLKHIVISPNSHRAMEIALLQINPTVGDLSGNAELIANGAREAGRLGADLVVTPELALLGYLPRDLLLKKSFIDDSWAVLEQLAKELAGGPPVLVGLAEPNRESVGRPL